jgi:hypothetical protein
LKKIVKNCGKTITHCTNPTTTTAARCRGSSVLPREQINFDLLTFLQVDLVFYSNFVTYKKLWQSCLTKTKETLVK